MRHIILTICAFLCLTSYNLVAAEENITVSDAWARTTHGRTMSGAAFLTLHNNGNQTVALTGVSGAVANHVELHQSYEKEGVMRMDHVENLPVPAGETVTLAPGGYHIMMMQLQAPLVEGKSFPLTLHFDKAPSQEVIVQITGLAGPQ